MTGEGVHAMRGFTLAEVLITLGIIGVVAALTIPALVAGYQKKVVETALARFYSNMNQAVKLSEIDNGEVANWEFTAVAYNGPALHVWFDKYFQPYLKTTDIKEVIDDDGRGRLEVYFADGSVDRIGWYGRDHLYCINAKKLNSNYVSGKDCFMFAFYPTSCDTSIPADEFFCGKGVEPYIYESWDGTEEGLKDPGMNAWAKIIQFNGWKIPDDYPIKF
jgi:prepilin-type N-terminal cleavage/methylation domain-containing protein